MLCARCSEAVPAAAGHTLSAMDWGLLAANIGLVGVTIALVYFTRGMVVEARATREEMRLTRAEMEEVRLLSVRPHLALEVSVLAPLYGALAVRNLGPGSAKDLSLTIQFEPMSERREWAWPTLAPGERHEFILPSEIDNLDTAMARELVAYVTGSYSDILGNTSAVDLEFAFAPWWGAARQAMRRFEEPALTKIARYAENAVKALEKLANRK